MTETKPQNELVIVAEKSGIEISKAQSYAVKFAPFMAKVTEVSERAKVINYETPSDKDASLARELRLSLVKNRTASEGIKTQEKEMILVEGRLIDSLFNVVKNASALTEGELMKVEKHRENQLIAEKAILKGKRSEALRAYSDNPDMFPLGEMTQEAFDNLLTGQKLAHEAKLEAEKQAEIKRIEDEKVAAIAKEKYEAEQAAIRVENERLKKEAEEKEAALKLEREASEKKLQAERDKAAAEKKATELAAQKERARLDAEIEARRKSEQEKAEKVRAEIQAKLDKERKEKEAAEKELQQKRDAEIAKIKEEEQRVQSQLAKGDAEKFADLLNDLAILRDKYQFQSTKYKKLKSACTEMLNKAINYLTTQEK